MEEERKRIQARKLAMQKLEEARARAKEGYEDERNEEEELENDDDGVADDKIDNINVDSSQRAKKITIIGISDVVKLRERKVTLSILLPINIIIIITSIIIRKM
jgi:hypothetical protein